MISSKKKIIALTCLIAEGAETRLITLLKQLRTTVSSATPVMRTVK